MRLQTVILAILTGSSIASAIPKPSMPRVTGVVPVDDSVATLPDIPYGCREEDGQVICPEVEGQLINARAAKKTPKKTPAAKSSSSKASKTKTTSAVKSTSTKSSSSKTTSTKSSASSKSTSTKSSSTRSTSSKSTSTRSTSAVTTGSKTTSASATSSATETANADCKRAVPVGSQPSCSLPIVGPVNQASIPNKVTCVGTGNSGASTNPYTRAEILAATNRGIQYAVMNKQATKGKYPHTFENTEGLALDPKCAGLTVQEFPILPGEILDAGSNSKKDVGLDRVLFTHPEKVKDTDEDTNNSEVFYCGIMTHSGKTVGKVQPFHLCT